MNLCMDVLWYINFDEFEILQEDNYHTWKSFMEKLLSAFGHWDNVSGKSTREHAQDKQQFDIIDELALSNIRLGIDTDIHPWVLEKFSSSKALWDSIEEKCQKKMELADLLVLPVPNLADDSMNSCGVFEDLLPDIGNGGTMEQSNIFSVFEDHTDLQQEKDHSSCITQLELPQLMVTNDCLLTKEVSNDVHDLPDTANLGVAELLDLQAMLPGSIQELESILFESDLQHEVVEHTSLLGNYDSLDLFHGDEQCTGITQEFMAEEEELISELPWLEIDSKTCDFKSVLSQVSDHELPFYVHVHIPFACPHDGKVAGQHLDDFSWYISYVFDTPAEGYEQLVVGLSGQTMAEFSKAYYDHDFMDCSPNSLPGQNMEQSYDTKTWFEVCYGTYTMKHFGIAGTRGTIDTFDILSAREWYRGRKIWSKIKDKDHSWILLWISLLYITSTA